ncbi:ATP11-domain-containing protein [Hypoxylon sp. FL1284]|nr:ATP11-domain-containing protein [Hypoxylon sp. FL1284]
MATVRVPVAALRSSLLLLGPRSPGPRLPAQQRRWARVHDVRFLATTQIAQKVHDKYREKLDRKAREEGLRDAGELREAYRDRIEELRRKDGVPTIPGLDALLADEAAPTTASDRQAQTPTTSPDGLTQTPPPPPQPQHSTGTGVKPLSEILDLPKARELPEKELSMIWRLRHAASPRSLCAVIPADTYASLEATARQHPSFVLPIPRAPQQSDSPDRTEQQGGAEMHYLQWVFDKTTRTATVLFTQLAEYKARGEWAQPHTTATHYWDEDLARSPGVVLMAGAVVDGRGASPTDARWLLMLLQRFYAEPRRAADEPRRALLEQFARGDGRFSVERLLEESEKLA